MPPMILNLRKCCEIRPFCAGQFSPTFYVWCHLRGVKNEVQQKKMSMTKEDKMDALV